MRNIWTLVILALTYLTLAGNSCDGRKPLTTLAKEQSWVINGPVVCCPTKASKGVWDCKVPTTKGIRGATCNENQAKCVKSTFSEAKQGSKRCVEVSSTR